MPIPNGSTDTIQGATYLKNRQQAVLVIFAFSSFMVILDAASLPIPLPSILKDLGGTLDAVTWVFGAFILAFAIFLLPCGRLADGYGRRVLFLSGGTVFAFGSLAAALAPSMTVLIGALAVQGIGAAMLEPAAHALIVATFPPEQHKGAFGAQRVGVFLGAALGPILSGGLTTVLSWHSIFWLNLLMGGAVVAGAVFVLPESRAAEASRRLDLPGLVLGASGLFFLLFSLIEGVRLG